ncbi:TPA: endopeptidase La [Candidatus Collierbacteria bacterium]|uniref:Lon protease n=2 Tax=Candidatus Collieribacteriota TaxID=1752725 RepID=A0A1F5FYG6_9BACT|nr:MAG: Lon protease [Microgenomates group bacterium GW2011_GWE1_47_12]KKU60137.1 MAG: Lon protease [Microgenomates group bacterium GW2011_GWD1_47_13]OGD74860.1 MAG: endopeptidase La [Candidatus Collierbacteria bacterium RIFOXYA2_FULL_46_10]OGD84663.1 MAG: endopeptidase La [Candidatus Collierbacteria bacterium RIFOXYD1_FULL_46_26]HBO10724.1 endopeptidase La [Candidatus Collierbacteria bacterium]
MTKTIFHSLLPVKKLPTHIVPLVPVRGVVVFPTNELVLTFGRRQSQQAVTSALTTPQKLIVIFTQKDADLENPALTDLYPVGTLCSVERTLKSDNELNALVRGIARVKFVRVIQESPLQLVEVEELPEQIELDAETEALAHHLTQELRTAVNLGKSIEFINFMRLMAGVSASELADQISVTLNVQVDERQKLLAELNLKKRLFAVNDYLAKELKVLEIEKNIASKTQEKFSKHMKETVLRERLATIKAELGENDPEEQELDDLSLAISQLKLPKKDQAKLQKEFTRLERMSAHNPESSYLRTWIETVLEMPWNKFSPDRVSLQTAEKVLNEDHYGLTDVKERILEYLSVMKLKKAAAKNKEGVALPTILCFVGPPGVGKTSLGQSIARSLKRKFVKVSLGGIRDEAEIRGHRKTYIGAMPGRIVEGMQRAGSMNPVFMLDEIDKVGADFRGDPSAALLEALDPEQNKAFSDHYLEIPLDLSQVMFICTANVLDTIPPALRDRLEIIRFNSYTRAEKFHIAKKYLLPKVITKNALTASVLKLSDTILKTIIAGYTREAGVRSLERELAKIARKVARQLASGKKLHSLSLPTLSRYLGPLKFTSTIAEKKNPVGMATGLAWTSIGGEILFIEVGVMPGSGKITLTGQLGDVMKESAQAAYSYIRSHFKELGLKNDFYKSIDVHVHVPEGSVPKDGPSAGVTLVTALISALTKKAVRKNLGMTGEITLRGRVLEIGGLKEKVIAAHTAGLRSIIYPASNTKDLEKIPAEIKTDLTFHPVENISEVLSLALV